MAINNNSRYIESVIEFIQLKEGGEQLPFVTYKFSNLGNITYDVHTYVEGQRLDQIAFNYYNRPSLWWVIAEFNPQIKDPMNIAPGTKLIIPHV